jgi:DNA-binding NarL/FixJ family response regulator
VTERTVLVVDDHAGFRACCRKLLEQEGYRVVAEAEDGLSAVDRTRELRPELALVDVHLPDIDGFEVAARLAALDDPPEVLLISSRERRDLGPLMAGCGARGFVPKDELSREAIEELL